MPPCATRKQVPLILGEHRIAGALIEVPIHEYRYVGLRVPTFLNLAKSCAGITRRGRQSGFCIRARLQSCRKKSAQSAFLAAAGRGPNAPYLCVGVIERPPNRNRHDLRNAPRQGAAATAAAWKACTKLRVQPQAITRNGRPYKGRPFSFDRIPLPEIHSLHLGRAWFSVDDLRAQHSFHVLLIATPLGC